MSLTIQQNGVKRIATQNGEAVTIHNNKKGHVSIMGTSQVDKIEIVRAPGSRMRSNESMVQIKINGKVVDTIPYSQIRSLSVKGGAGNDTILIDPSLSINTYIDGGSGNDYIRGGSGRDFITGGAGNDVIHSGKGNDYIHDGSGNDKIRGGPGKDRISDWPRRGGVRPSPQRPLFYDIQPPHNTFPSNTLPPYIVKKA